MKHIIILTLLLVSSNVLATYDWEKFKTDFKSPLENEFSRNIVYTGSALTGLLVIFRPSIVDPFQEDNAGELLDEDTANFGDLMGMLVPNILYVGGAYFHYKITDNNKSLARSTLMFKTTVFAGGTTTILKRIVNQQRPDKGDRLSFPSGHTTTAFAFASVIGIEHEWYWGAGAYSLATVVAMSRIHDNVHYLHDVVFGATIGTAFGIGLYYLQNKSDNIALSILPLENGASIAGSFKF